MAKCWRCGGGKTISVTTTGTHVLPCPTCGGSGESPLARTDVAEKVIGSVLVDAHHTTEAQLLAKASDFYAEFNRK
jgi:hypothetical protein